MTKNYIAGDWVAASEASPNINPSNTGDVIGDFARASAAEAEAAISAAYDALLGSQTIISLHQLRAFFASHPELVEHNAEIPQRGFK